ncbi:MAG: hypothetical protein JOZ49_16870 [Mycolicibacterium sp.]|nr:hypothetical protein [Mycolicibacterium sp.]
MAFKLTYTDGQEDDYDDATKWEVESGVLKMGREHGKWTVLVSPSHWATIEVAEDNDNDQTQKQDNDQTQKQDKDQTQKQDKDGDEDQAQDA